ncbi:hypothetical protein [Marinobacter mangrovi]|uniref:hypothetical protein n=1 Tax=Marinobacter mangrovi TaxID=2803918 RepID=UPI001931B99A|nr:hypothetical protein [Marinobacter mangrovi]
MAILKRKLLVPDEEFVSFLQRLDECKVLCPSESSAWSDMLILESGSGDRMSLSSDYVNIEFKFEVFYLSSSDSCLSEKLDLKEIFSVVEMSSAKFLFQVAWLRPALPGEVPPNYEQVVEEVGVRNDIPEAAYVAGLYVKGILILSNERPVIAIASSGDNPDVLVLAVDEQEIDAVLGKCEQVSPFAVHDWIMQLKYSGWV